MRLAPQLKRACLLSSVQRLAYARPSLASQARVQSSTVGAAFAPGRLTVSVRAMGASGTATMEVEAPAKPQPIFRADYKPPAYLIDTVHLTFNLNEDVSHVTSRLALKPNYAENGVAPPLLLNGRDDVKLVGLKVAGQAVPDSGYEVTPKSLTLLCPPAGPFELEVVTAIKPQDNSLLEGLYKSGGNYCTQCEAEGFRGITYFLDRPDVMARYTTRIEADAAKYPVLLSNGNLKEEGQLEGGRHYAVWEDPFPKPCYLFALVAGALVKKEDTYTTGSGKTVTLRIYTQPANISQVDFAMVSLKKSMKWDEDVYGLEYDLDLFNIVAVDDFNMGAMENKSLNIFNSRLVLADPDSSTDGDYARIEGVVGHEYFHNWTGNRVTCRDWFQLTLKEGLTVFRDQGFSADMNSAPVKRIEDVALLRASQFSEDAGPMAHPIRPDSYIKMDNFYTVTVYEKGSEIIRLYHTLLGPQGFRKGMDLYFQRHDGQAVTCDDFLAAMADANGEDLSGVGRWYSQAGTPTLTVSTAYDAAKQSFTISTHQATPPTNGQPDKLPVLIPLKVGLLGPDGQDLPLHLEGKGDLGASTVLRCDAEHNSFTFTDVAVEPVPSLLRGFSAPVKLVVQGQTDDHLRLMFAHDRDPFNRWEAGQRLYMKLLLQLYSAAAGAASSVPLAERCAAAGGVPGELVAAFRAVLEDGKLDGSFKAMAMRLPSMAEVVDRIDEADPVLVWQVRHYVYQQLAQQLRPQLEAAIKANDVPPGTPYEFNAQQCARRVLRNMSESILGSLESPEIQEQLLRRFREATNMTDRMAALTVLCDTDTPGREQALQEFYEVNKDKPLVLLKWLAVQASCALPGNIAKVRALMEHPAFTITTPNCCYSLFLGFARSVNFHAADGSGYEFIGDSVIKMDKINHQVASRIAGAFTTFKQYDKERQAMMVAQLRRIAAVEGLSENVFEIVTKSLQQV